MFLELALGALDRGHLLGSFHDLAYGGFVFGAFDQFNQAVILRSK